MRFSTLALLLTCATAPLVAQSTTTPRDAIALDTFTVAAQNAQATRPPNNVRLELTITDTYTGQPTAKTVTMLIENGRGGMIRTSNRLPSNMEVNLNVDARVETIPTGIRTQVTFEYTPAQTIDGSSMPSGRPAQLHESFSVVLRDGERTMVSESADPATDRKVTVELTATRVQ